MNRLDIDLLARIPYDIAGVSRENVKRLKKAVDAHKKVLEDKRAELKESNQEFYDGMCFVFSAEFVGWLVDVHGFTAPVEVLRYDEREQTHYPYKFDCGEHWVVAVGNWGKGRGLILDWTAKQFVVRARTPAIWRLDPSMLPWINGPHSRADHLEYKEAMRRSKAFVEGMKRVAVAVSA